MKQKTGAGYYRTTLRMALDSDSYSGEGEGGDFQSSSSAKWISTRRFDAFAEPSVSSATLRDPARPTQSRRARSMPRATKASATAVARPSEKATAPPLSPPKSF